MSGSGALVRHERPLRPGDTCWRSARAGRAAFLIDTEAWFHRRLRGARAQARRSVTLLGWGFDPRARLFPDGFERAGRSGRGGPILVALAKERPDLRYPPADLEIGPAHRRQPAVLSRARRVWWFQDTGVKFVLDDQVPFGGLPSPEGAGGR